MSKLRLWWVVLLLSSVLLASTWGCSLARLSLAPTPTPTKTPRPPATATLPPTVTPLPTNTITPTATRVLPPTATPAPPTNTPASPTDTPVPPTKTPKPAAPKPPPPPTNTPLPTNTPAPAVDFKLIEQHILSKEENKGNDAGGDHTLFLYAVDKAGQPLNGIVFQDIRNNQEAISGDKGPGKAEMILWRNTAQIVVKRDQAGQQYTSDTSHPLSLMNPVLEDLVAPGYCDNVESCANHPPWHFSYKLVFQKQ